jgi:hypothetical protein
MEDPSSDHLLRLNVPNRANPGQLLLGHQVDGVAEDIDRPRRPVCHRSARRRFIPACANDAVTNDETRANGVFGLTTVFAVKGGRGSGEDLPTTRINNDLSEVPLWAIDGC